MKTLLSIITAFAAFAHAQQPEPPKGSIGVKQPVKTNLSLTVRNVLAKNITRDHYKTDWGSYDKRNQKEQTIELAFSNVSFSQARADVIVTWLGKRPGRDELLAVKSTKVPIAIGAGETIKFENGTGLMKSRDLNLELANARFTEGVKVVGWRVTVRDDAKHVLIAQASLPSLAYDPENQTPFVAGVKMLQSGLVVSPGYKPERIEGAP